jgi:hypothetical protein
MHYVIRQVGRLRRWWHLFLTHVLKIEVTVYVMHESGRRDSWLKPYFLCPGCNKYQDWEFGCADDKPELCDACWESKQCPKPIPN